MNKWRKYLTPIKQLKNKKERRKTEAKQRKKRPYTNKAIKKNKGRKTETEQKKREPYTNKTIKKIRKKKSNKWKEDLTLMK